LSLFGCNASLKEAKAIKEDLPYTVSEEPSIKHDGSLWQDNGSLSELFIDPTARKIGDIVTIQIVRRIPQRSDFHFPGNQSSRCRAGKTGDNLMPGPISLPDVPCQTINLPLKLKE